MFSIYQWKNLVDDSPQAQTRNQWLYKYGAFCRYNGLWFPCRISGYTTIGEPYQVIPIMIATTNQGIYPGHMVNVTELDVLYTIFNDGTSLEAYIQTAMNRKNVTTKMLDGALIRSLNTEIVAAPTSLLNQVKKSLNRLWKGESFVVNTQNAEEIKVVPLPHTANILENLWNSNDWALQEVSQLLGISYNPAHGKKERMLQNEMLGDRDLTIMNRERLTSRLIIAAEKFNEEISHISSHIDCMDRGLKYGSTEKEDVVIDHGEGAH